MSVLEFPRVYFKGQVSWDPVTTNNYPADQAPAAYDENDCTSLLDAKAIGAAQVQALSCGGMRRSRPAGRAEKRCCGRRCTSARRGASATHR